MSYYNSQEDRKGDSLWLTLFTTPTSSFATWRLYKPFDFPAVRSGLGLGRAHPRPFVFLRLSSLYSLCLTYFPLFF